MKPLRKLIGLSEGMCMNNVNSLKKTSFSFLNHSVVIVHLVNALIFIGVKEQLFCLFP